MIINLFFLEKQRGFAYCLMLDFYLHVNINYFNYLSDNMKYIEDYKSSFYRIINKHVVLI